MAFPTVQSVTATAFDVDSTAHLVAMPAVVDSGDLLIVLFSNDSDATVTTPTGWTLLDSATNGTANRLSIYYKSADGTEDGTTVDFVTSTSQTAHAQVYRITGWHGTSAPQVGTAATGSSAAPDPPSATPSWGAEDNLWIAASGNDRGNSYSAAPTNYTNLVSTAGGGAGGDGLGSARRNLNATTDDPAAFTLDASRTWVTQLVVVRPAAGSTDRRYQVSFAELEVPNEPRRYQVSWTELEVPEANRRYQVSWAELELPNEPRRYQVSFAEMEVPEFNRRYQVSFAEFEVPPDPAAPGVQFQRAAYVGLQAP